MTRSPDLRHQPVTPEQGGNEILPIRRPRRTRLSLKLAPALAALMLATAACASISNPDGWAGPVLSDDTLYLTTDNGELSAVNPDDFSTVWTFPATDQIVCGGSTEPRDVDLRGIYGVPQVGDAGVYVAGYDGNVYSLDREDGACNWVFEADGPIVGGLVLVEDRIYFGSDDGNLYVLNAEDGSEIDRFEAGDPIWVTPLVDGGVVFVATVDGELYALDAETIEPVWGEPFDVKGGLLTNPVLARDDTLLVGGIGEVLYAVDRANGSEKWSYSGSNWFWGTPLVDRDRGVIYAPNLDGRIYALSLDGEEQWVFRADNAVRSSPVIIGETLMVIDRDGNVYGVDPEEGVSLWPAPAQLKKTVLSDPIPFEDGILVVAQGGDIFRLNEDGGALRRIEVSTR